VIPKKTLARSVPAGPLAYCLQYSGDEREICIKYAKPAPGTVFARDLLVTGITGSLLTKRKPGISPGNPVRLYG